MKEFYIVSGDNVQKKELRETPKFYINDATGEKFKKSENSDYLAHYRYNGGRWSSIHYYVYNLDHEKPNEIIEKNKRSMFAWEVKRRQKKELIPARPTRTMLNLITFSNLILSCSFLVYNALKTRAFLCLNLQMQD